MAAGENSRATSRRWLAGYAMGHAATGPHRHTFGGLADAAFRLIPLLEAGRDASWPWDPAAVTD